MRTNRLYSPCSILRYAPDEVCSSKARKHGSPADMELKESPQLYRRKNVEFVDGSREELLCVSIEIILQCASELVEYH